MAQLKSRPDPNAGRTVRRSATRAAADGAGARGALAAGRQVRLRPDKRSSAGRSVALLVAAVLVLSAAGALSAVIAGKVDHGATLDRRGTVHATTAPGRSSKVLPATNAELMGLVELGGSAAPGFTLTDQNGQAVSLRQLDRHHAVVLAFMDDKCTDICPILANELADAAHNLGTTAAKVDFVGVNVNAAHNATATLRSFIAVKGHGVGTLPNFYYLTGSAASLAAVWQHYGITVKVAAGGKVFHSEGLYFIARGGAERFEATPYANLRKDGTGWLPPATLTQWGHGIAQYAKRTAG